MSGVWVIIETERNKRISPDFRVRNARKLLDDNEHDEDDLTEAEHEDETVEDAESRRPSEEDKPSTGYESGCVLMPNTSVGCTNLRGPDGAAVATLGLLPRALVSVTAAAAAVVVSLFAGAGNDDADDAPSFTEVRAVLALLSPRTSGCI